MTAARTLLVLTVLMVLAIGGPLAVNAIHAMQAATASLGR